MKSHSQDRHESTADPGAARLEGQAKATMKEDEKEAN